MALIEYNLFGKIDKVQMAIDRLKAFEPEEGYEVGDSGGKDSTVIVALAKMAGVKHQAVYNVTSVDPPELVRFIKEKRPDTKIRIPHDTHGNPVSMWNLIPKKGMPPTRLIRYCCEALKESQGKGKVVVTGVRWAESANRKRNQGAVTITGKGADRIPEVQAANFTLTERGGVVLNDDNDEARRAVEVCYRTRKTLVNPIIDWTDDDVWEFIKTENLPYCELYDCGYKRLGCIGCPMATGKGQRRDFERYPKYRENYLKAFQRMIDENHARGRRQDRDTPEEVMAWWMQEERRTT